MAACTICGKPAGILRSVHRDCATNRTEALERLAVVIQGYLGLPDEKASVEGLRRVFDKVAELAQLDPEETEREFQNGLRSAILTITNDGEITDQEFHRVSEITEALGADLTKIDETTNELLVQAMILRDLRKGVVQSRLQDVGSIPITLKRGESLIWLSAPVTRMEPRTKTKYVGRSHGFSVRIARGLSYRVGASEGERIETTSLVPAGAGGLAYTNHAIYFLSQGNNLRLPAKSIATVDCYSDGICVTPNRGKSQIFLMNNQKFASDMIKAICALS